MAEIRLLLLGQEIALCNADFGKIRPDRPKVLPNVLPAAGKAAHPGWF